VIGMSKHYDGRSWFAADTFLRGGKFKDYRPVGCNTYLARIDDESIALVYHSTAIVVYHVDGSCTIRNGGWETVTTRQRLNEFSPARVHSTYDRKRPGWTLGQIEGRTPSRRQKCRTCSGAGGSVERPTCYGGGWAFDATTGSMRRKVCVHGQRRQHTYGEIYANECYRCHGEGVCEYGDRVIFALWDGSPIKIDEHGDARPDLDVVAYSAPPRNSSKAKAPVDHHYSSTATYKHHAGGEVKRELAALLPGLTTRTKCPVFANGGDECQLIAGQIGDLIVHLNDNHRWTREHIADWLDTLDADLRFPIPEGTAA
jgi:hypothetical protein